MLERVRIFLPSRGYLFLVHVFTLMILCVVFGQVAVFRPEDVDSIDVPTVVKYYNPDCPHCRAFAPEYDRFADLASGIRVAELNCIEFSEYCAEK